MKLDGRGLEVTTNSGAEIHAINHFAEELLALGADLPCVGGSDEQRGVFIQSHLIGLIRSGQKAAAERALREYIGTRGITPLEQRWRDQI